MNTGRALRPYRFGLLLLSPLLMAYTLWRGFRDGSRRYIQQRLSLNYPALQKPVWFHCASVGEVNAALPLICLATQRNKSGGVLITTNTVSGAATVARHALPDVVHCYLPLDLRFAVRRFLCATRPRIALILETELWPNLYQMVFENEIDLLIVNARLSGRTIDARPWLSLAYRQCCENTTMILARSELDARRFHLLGARREKIRTLGNIKFASTATANRTPQNLVGRRYVLAISTHHDEEMQLAAATKSLAIDDLLLVIVPRHPQRSGAIVRQLDKLDIAFAVRSKKQPIDDLTNVYLADTFGELDDFIAFAAFVIVGGSLVPHGGQNILEPARSGRAILCGPHMDNFAEELLLFQQQQAIVQIVDSATIESAIASLWSDEPRCRALGEAAEKIVDAHANITRNYFDAIAAYL